MSINKRVVKVAANILSTPSRIKSGGAIRRANNATSALQTARKFKGSPDFTRSGMPSGGFKARTNAASAVSKFRKGLR